MGTPPAFPLTPVGTARDLLVSCSFSGRSGPVLELFLSPNSSPTALRRFPVHPLWCDIPAGMELPLPDPSFPPVPPGALGVCFDSSRYATSFLAMQMYSALPSHNLLFSFSCFFGNQHFLWECNPSPWSHLEPSQPRLPGQAEAGAESLQTLPHPGCEPSVPIRHHPSPRRVPVPEAPAGVQPVPGAGTRGGCSVTSVPSMASAASRWVGHGEGTRCGEKARTWQHRPSVPTVLVALGMTETATSPLG